MSYIDGVVIPVPTGNKQKFIDHSKTVDALFLEHGATRVLECWGDDVKDGKQTDLPDPSARHDEFIGRPEAHRVGILNVQPPREADPAGGQVQLADAVDRQEHEIAGLEQGCLVRRLGDHRPAGPGRPGWLRAEIGRHSRHIDARSLRG